MMLNPLLHAQARVDQTTPTPALDTGPKDVTQLSVCDKLNLNIIDDIMDDDEEHRIFRTFSDPGLYDSMVSTCI